MKTKVLILVLVLFLGTAGVVLANDSLELQRWALGGGASDSGVNDITLRATLGQPVVGVVSDGDITLGQGFWKGGPLGENRINLYLPFVQR